MKTITLLLTLLLSTTVFAKLPPKIQAKRHMLKAMQLKAEYQNKKEQEDRRKMYKSIEYFKKAIALKVKLPADFYFEYGEVIYQLYVKEECHLIEGVTAKEGLKAFEKFLSNTKEENENYMKALDYYNQLEADKSENILNSCNKENNGKSCYIVSREICGDNNYSHSNEEKYLKKACDFKNGKGCNMLGFKLGIIGLGLPKDKIQKQLKIFKKSCNLNYGIGCANVGYTYKVQKNIEKAKEYYKKGCDLKFEDSCTYLKELNK